MATVVGDLVVRLRAETAELTAGLAKAGGELKAFQGATGGVSQELGSAEQAAAGAAGEAENLATKSASTEKALTGNAGAASRFAGALEKASAQFSKLSGTEDPSVFSKLGSTFKSVATLSTEAGSGVLGMSGAMTAGIAVAVALATALGVEAVKAYTEHEDALLKLQNVISNTPTLVGSSIEAFDNQADAIQNVTGVQRDQIIAADAMIGRFGLTAKQITTLNPLIADYATATGVAVPTAGSQLGRALLGNTRALKAIGIQFTATGDRAKDFNTIQQDLQQKVGGLAKQFGQTLPGQMSILGGQFHDLMITLGKQLTPVITQVVHGFTLFVGFLVRYVVPVLGKVLVFALKAVITAIHLVVIAIQGWIRFFAVLGGWITKAVGWVVDFASKLAGVPEAIGHWLENMPLLGRFFTDLGHWVSDAIGWLGKLIGGIGHVAGSIWHGLVGAWHTLTGAQDDNTESAQHVVSAQVAQMQKAAQLQQSIENVTQAVKNSTAEFTGPGIAAIKSFTDASGQNITDFVSKARAALLKGGTTMQTFINGVGSSYRGIITTAQGTLQSFITGPLQTLASNTDTTMQDIVKAVHSGGVAMEHFVQDLETIAKRGGDAGKALAQYLLTLGPTAAGMAKTIADSSSQAFNKLTGDWANFSKQSQSLATDLVSKIVGPLHSILHAIESIPGWDQTKFNTWKTGADGTGKSSLNLAQSVGSVGAKFSGIVGPMQKSGAQLRELIQSFNDCNQKLTENEKKNLSAAIQAGHYQQAIDILTKAMNGNTGSTNSNTNKQNDWYKQIVGNTNVTNKQTDTLKQLTDQLPNNTHNLSDNVRQLIDQADKANNAHDKIALLRQALEDMARGNYNFDIGASTSKAEASLNNLFNKMRDAGFSLAKAPQGQVLRFHEGGMVPSQQHMASSMGLHHDEVPAVLKRGEFVVNERATSLFRGHLEKLNRYHDGGAVDLTPYVKTLQSGLNHPPPVNVNVDVGPAMIDFLRKQFQSGYMFPFRDVRSMNWGRIDEGVDFTGEGPVYAVGPGKVAASSTNTGWPGGGWISYQLTAGAKKGQWVYLAENITPSIHAGQMVNASTQIATMHNAYPYIETGWAVPGGTDLALAHGHYTEGVPTAEGRNFEAFLRSLPSKADNGAFFQKRTDVSMMPGEIALAPDSVQSVRALSKAMGQAARYHTGGIVMGPQSGDHGERGDGFHLGKLVKLLHLIGSDHIARKIDDVKSMYKDHNDKFPTSFVLDLLHKASMRDVHKVAPHADSVNEFVKKLADNVAPWAGHGGHGGHGGGQGSSGGGGGGQGHGFGGVFGKVFGDFAKTLGMTTTPELARSFITRLQAEYRSTGGLDIGEITRVVNAMFQEGPAATYLDALTTRFENTVHGKTVHLLDKKGANFSVTQMILKMLGAHGTGSGDGGGGAGGGAGGGQGQLAFHLGPLQKLLQMMHKHHIKKILDELKQRYTDNNQQFPFDWLKNVIRGASLSDIHKVASNQKSVDDFLHWLAGRIDHSPASHGHGGGGGGHGGHGGGGSGGHLADVVKKLDHVWSQGASRVLSWNEVTDIAHAVGYDRHKGIIMSAISAPESGRQPHPKDNVNTNGSRDKGILQFNSVHHLPNSLVYNPVASFRHAKGWDLHNWATFNNGSYRHFIPAASHAWGGWHGTGLDATFKAPTFIGVGERGAEHVKVTPASSSGIDDLHLQVVLDRRRFTKSLDYDIATRGW